MSGLQDVRGAVFTSSERQSGFIKMASGNRLDLASRWPLILRRAMTLAGILFTILTGLIGSPVGGHNLAIIFVWIAGWWGAREERVSSRPGRHMAVIAIESIANKFDANGYNSEILPTGEVG